MDTYRQRSIESLGIKFIRFTNNQITSNIDFVIEEINKKLLPLRRGD